MLITVYAHNEGFLKTISSQPLLMFLCSEETLTMHCNLTIVKFISLTPFIYRNEDSPGVKKAGICQESGFESGSHIPGIFS